MRSRARTSVAWMMLTLRLVQVLYSPLLVDWDQKTIDPLYADRIAHLRARVSTAGDAPIVTVLGSSKAARGILGAPLESHLAAASGRQTVAFNFACGGCGPVMETVVLQRLLRDGVHPALVLIEVFPALLARTMAAWSSAMDRDDHLTLTNSPIAPWGPFDLAVPAMGASFRRPMPSDAAAARLGAGWRPRTSIRAWATGPVNAWGELPDRLRGCLNAERQPTPGAFVPNTHGWEHDARTEGIVVTARLSPADDRRSRLVVMPEGSAFRGWQAVDGLMETMRFVHQLGAEYGAPVVDARQWLDDRSFRDSVHLLPAAAHEFTVRLSGQIDRMVE